MSAQQKYWVIIPAAGSGKRLGADVPKQYLKINGKFILDHTIKPFIDIPEIEYITVTLAENDSFWRESIYVDHAKIKTTIGGKERYHSVLNGLEHINPLAAKDDWVLVHDAARPCIRQSDIKKLIEELMTHQVGGLLAVPVKDTMKRSDKTGEVVATVERSDLWHAQTPQMFKYSDLSTTLKKIVKEGLDVTDEAQAIERLGFKPKLVHGHQDNIKITHKSDINLARLLLNEQEAHK